MKTLLALFLLFLLGACQEKKQKSSQTIYYNMNGEPSTINPMSSSADSYTMELHSYIFEGLLERDLETYEWKPALATAWKISDDKKVFDFKLREGVKWQDGVELTAEDIKYSLDVIFTDDYGSVFMRPFFESVKEVQVIDKYNVRFILKDDLFQNFSNCATLPILPKHFYTNPENKKDFNRKLIGTGPYVYSKHEKGQKLVLTKNPAWWGNTDEKEKNTNTIQKIVYRFVKDENVQLELLKKGDLDFLGLRPEAFVKKTEGKIWEEKITKVKTENKTPKGYNFIGWNLKNPILKDREVRHALALLFNRNLMREKFEFNISEDATGPIYVQSDYASPNLKPVPFDPKLSLEILTKNGWKDSDKDGTLDKVINGKKTDLSLTILEPNPDMMKYLTIYKEDASKVGVEINLKNIEWNSFIKLLDEKKFEGVRLAWGGGSIDWDPKQVWHSSSAKGNGSNFVSYANPEVDRLIDEARKIYDKEKRVEMLRRVDEIIANDYPYVFFFNNKYSMYGTTKRVERPKDTFTYGLGQQYWKLK
ncbi:MAG: ABC transporter substrate-binding protein [Bacteriovoracaceae bacterium]